MSRRYTYISRSRNLLCTRCRETAYLYDSVQRLLDAGLLMESNVGNS